MGNRKITVITSLLPNIRENLLEKILKWKLFWMGISLGREPMRHVRVYAPRLDSVEQEMTNRTQNTLKHMLKLMTVSGMPSQEFR